MKDPAHIRHPLWRPEAESLAADTAAVSNDRNRARLLPAFLALAVVLIPSTVLGVRLSRLNDGAEIPASAPPAVNLSVTSPRAETPPKPPAPKLDRAAWSRLMRESRENIRLRNLEEAERSLLAALSIGDHHGPPDQRTQTTLFYLEKIADDYYTSGRYSQHARLTPQFILVAEAVRGATDPSVAAHRLSLARSFEETGQVQSARSILDSLLLGPPSPPPMERASLLLQRASLLSRIAETTAPDRNAEQRREDLNAAEADVDEALAILDESAESEPLHRLAALQRKATILGDQGRPKEAESVLIEALAVAQLNAPASTSEAVIQAELAEFYREQARDSDALAYAQTAADQFTATNAPVPAQLDALDALASILIALDRDAEAEAVFQRGFAFAEQDPEATKTLKDHYAAWKEQGDAKNEPQGKQVRPRTEPPAPSPEPSPLPAPEQ